jgi:lipid A 4'-phosphatase
MLLHPAHYWKVRAGLRGLIVVFSTIFLMNPDIDIAVSGLFYDLNTGNFAGKSAFFLALRECVNFGFHVVALASLALLINGLIRKNSKIPVSVWGFVVTSLIVGPGILANLVLKAHWGRARPDSITEFGGARMFTPPLVKTDQCDFNCSFISGEASSLSSIAILTGLLFASNLSVGGRRKLIMGSIALTIYACFMRIFMGRHFLSDTLFAVLFCATVIWIFWRVFKVANNLEKVTFSALWFDLRGIFRSV